MAKSPVVTIGNFDGVHRGHQEIISLAVRKARERGGQAIAFTFRPHPRAVLNPGQPLQLLTSYDEKVELIKKLGVDLVIEEPFSREFSVTEPERFFNDVLLNRLSAQAIVVGYDFGFGRGRQGQLETMAGLCQGAGVELTVVQALRFDGEVVSSSRVRQYLTSGDVATAARLLGRRFSYKGIVQKGDGRGRKIGFPTANLRTGEKLLIPYGVYATQARTGGAVYPSVTNLGIRPTFDAGTAPLIETHLLGVTLDLYGSDLEVEFVERIRDERKFAGIDELKVQIALDVAKAREISDKSSKS